MWAGVGSRRCEPPDLDRPVIACRCKVLIRRVESKAFDMALMADQRLELLKSVARPNHYLGIQPNSNQYRRVV